MNVVFAASECAPFIKTGGLGDVIGALPKALKKQGVHVSVILPKYGDLPNQFKQELEHMTSIEVPVGWRQQFCGIEKLVANGITYYFLDNEYYFKRHGSYGFFDDGERFAFFSRAILEALPYLEEKPDVIHCHDWQTGLVSVLMKAHYHNHPFYQDIKTIFTIHNLRYQGVYPKVVLAELLDLSELYFNIDGLEFHGNVSYLKAGLAFSNIVTTVSPSYAEEIQLPYFGENLDGFLRKRKGELKGIINGIDYEEYNPAADEHLAVPFDSYEGKMENKRQLQESLGLPVNDDVPVLSMVTRLVDQKGIDLVLHVFHEMMNQGVQFILLGTGEEQYESAFRHLADQYPNQVSVHTYFDEGLARRIYAGSDLFLMPSQFEPCGIGQLLALRYGTLPLVRETGGLRDTVIPYNQFTGEGNGFSFTNYNAHDMLHTIEQSVGLYKFQPKRWRKMAENAMKLDFSWTSSSLKYMELYESLIPVMK
ncbi:glycogen synthase GlgA [Peribacillus frigoritolerans]|uniref:glycogen synthase GlgA n=1 Tax=Peribacillus frigoritolerans TaxID=450367 RepID=UPI0022262DB4|nr:glycogen synthase GlgA [Peribacillus frigoritolerans]MCY9006031.1 glycogen synthase GlgA [Peribacillus frigoritolerans]MED4631389.1 glycogen synthase GlgA [Peribacillus frigoritolerans]UYZ01440.1 glycogen synthase GlgA [Peribacillus frigoritolerans]